MFGVSQNYWSRNARAKLIQIARAHACQPRDSNRPRNIVLLTKSRLLRGSIYVNEKCFASIIRTQLSRNNFLLGGSQSCSRPLNRNFSFFARPKLLLFAKQILALSHFDLSTCSFGALFRVYCSKITKCSIRFTKINFNEYTPVYAILLRIKKIYDKVCNYILCNTLSYIYYKNC